jgi:hypothetical protein
MYEVSCPAGKRVLYTPIATGVAAGSPLLQVIEGRKVADILIIGILVGVAGFGLLYSGYRLPGTNIRSALSDVVPRWFLRAIGALIRILLLVEVVADMDDPIATILILVPLASIAISSDRVGPCR